MSFIYREEFNDLGRALHSAHLEEVAEEELLEGLRRQDKRIDAKKKKDDKELVDPVDLMTAAIIVGATDLEIREITARTGLHQNISIEALQENREQLDAAEEELEDILDQAFVLEDGRRVFLSEDGLRVIDELGQDVDADIIDPSRIDPTKPRYDKFLESKLAFAALMEEQDQLLTYQNELDKFAVAIERGNLSRDDVAEMNAYMTENAPAAIRAKLPESDPAHEAAADNTQAYVPSFGQAPDATASGPSDFDPSKLFQ